MIQYQKILGNKKKSKILTRIVAHLMCDGCLTKKYFAYYNKNDVLIENFENDIRGVFSDVHVTTGKVNSGTDFRMVTNKKINNFLLTLMPDYRSFSLRWPNFVDTIEKKKEFLRALYDDEGCVAMRIFNKTGEVKRNLTLSSNSRKLLIKVKNVLLKDFGISTNRLYKNLKYMGDRTFTNYILSITGRSNFQKFQREIGFAHPTKGKKLNDLIGSYIRLAATT